jgi:hypothetical protein
MRKKVQVLRRHGKLKIYINGLIHLIIDETYNPIRSVQSYLWPEKEHYHIEYWLKDGKLVKTWYCDKNIWGAILKELDTIL